jgi:transcriptional regulator with XRE-family HTH domain
MIYKFSGQKLRKIREINRLSMAHLGAKIGFKSAQQIIVWEKGRSIPNGEHIGLLAGALNTCVCAFYEPESKVLNDIQTGSLPI